MWLMGRKSCGEANPHGLFAMVQWWVRQRLRLPQGDRVPTDSPRNGGGSSPHRTLLPAIQNLVFGVSLRQGQFD